MNSLSIGDLVQNSLQCAIVRWLGSIEEIPIIGLQLINSTLPGYTDGTCSLDNQRYFICSNGHGYYVLESSFHDSYKIIKKTTEINNATTSDDDFNSPEQSLSTSPKDSPIYQHPIRSYSSPSVSQIQHNLDKNSVISPSRGVLSRLTFEREQRNSQINSTSHDEKNSLTHASSAAQSDPTLSRIYCPENYKSTSCDRNEELEVENFISNEGDNENNTTYSIFEITNNNNLPLPHASLPLFGQEYFLNNWTLHRVKSLVQDQIPIFNQLCLNVFNDKCILQNLIDEQIDGCCPRIPNPPPNDISIELIKLFDNVKIIYPSRAIRLYNNDYLLLAILCSNNQCAYVRTSTGWAYTDDDSEHGYPIVVDEISEMINGSVGDINTNSEQCLHVLKNASFLYYKLVQ
ncbi:unnamed protein product [Rotaria magnacalcarata]|uniref:CAP-Gly domain-containing protein n=1 Tax=Rotaria magnacalcarata TaxID=392030 RepID=A0A818XRA0_9BILA|nr:unnamed protein product [Rotaria magnacalcarata]CAF3742210.1 unnamed protein product [Rotaria magnacalcarata]